ncbi:MAG: sugar transferase [Verrucomicrobiota bacterium]|jgi:exopolysaccharide biosynthesis polyprenyl glycosylphosphotransferase
MLQRDRQIRTQVHQLADACLFAASFWLAYAVRGNAEFTNWINYLLPAGHTLEVIPPEMFNNVWRLYFALVPAAPLVLESQGFYNRPSVSSRKVLILPLLRGSVLVTVGIVLLLFFFKTPAPRGVAFIFIVFSCSLVWLKEEILMAALRSPMAKAQYKRRVIVAGVVTENHRLRQMLKAWAGDEMEVVAEFNLAESPTQNLIELLHEHSASSVLISAKHTDLDRVENVIRLCETEGVEAWLIADFFATKIARASFDEIMGRPLMVFRSTPETSWQMLAKQLLDFVGALVLLVLSSPVMLTSALLIKLTSPGPVMFRQQRSGLNGAPFSIYKFRTMMSNAEQFKHELAAMNEMSGPVFKVTNDPRITPIGRWLRKFSLDELPQLFNVVRGEMSLVGPRPLPVDEVRRFNDLAHRRRLSVKPGITCLWQVSGRNKICDFKDWVRLDLQYIDNWSFWLDLVILARTVPVVLLGTGAK